MIRRLAARAGLETAGQISPYSLRVAFIVGAREGSGTFAAVSSSFPLIIEGERA